MKLEDIKNLYEHSAVERSPNYLNIPKTFIRASEDGIKEFNEIYQCVVLNNPYGLRKVERTPSGGIKSHKTIRFQYDVIDTKNSIELTYIGPEGMYRWILNGRPQGISGGQSFKRFIKKCKEKGIKLEDFAIMNGEEVKTQIESPKIHLYGRPERVYLNAHHLDINSSYMAGIAYAQPELYDVIKEIYDLRKVDKDCKDILTHTYGYMQSKWCQVTFEDGVKYPYAFAHLSLEAIAFNNRKIESLIDRLRKAGRHVIATNTDGIWYTGEIYHDEDEGVDLGQWKNDHTNCKIRFKSKGCYEYEENGSYYPVMRGRTRLDHKKDRSEWEWGDIFTSECDVVKCVFDEGKGAELIYEKESYGI